MLVAERKKIILEKLQADKKVIVSRLSELFNVSDETIRRDLDRLCQEGIAIKTYGGAVLNEDGPDLPFNVRKIHNPDEKRKIAELIEPLIQDGDSIMLDASTTAVFVAKALKEKKCLKVITNSIEVMVELSDNHDWTVISTGGNLMGDYLAFSGPRTISDIASYRVDKFIFSCKGLDTAHGILDSNDNLAQVKREMIKAAKTKILAADQSKFNRTAFSKIASIADIDVVVTNAVPEKIWRDAFTKHGVRCLY
ncbi:MAG: DeoR/GlpR family DNA-binding transcription regulator [Firmicutes bacterium]|nr:DeoR/GlpR family DNA-binding transcription regulator [Bacillota bacterium]